MILSITSVNKFRQHIWSLWCQWLAFLFVAQKDCVRVSTDTMTYECSLTVKIGGSNPSDGGSIPSARAIIGCVKLVSLMMLVLNHDIADE